MNKILTILLTFYFSNFYCQKIEYKIVEKPDIVSFEGIYSSSNYYFDLNLEFWGCCTGLTCDTKSETDIKVKGTYEKSEIEINSKKFNLAVCTLTKSNIKRGTMGLVDEYGEFIKKTKKNKQGYQFPETSFIKLNKEDISHLTLKELYIMRNEIYAKHGYKFNNKNLELKFYKKDWYKRFESKGRKLTKDVELSEIEKHNAELIKEVEKSKK